MNPKGKGKNSNDTSKKLKTLTSRLSFSNLNKSRSGHRLKAGRSNNNVSSHYSSKNPVQSTSRLSNDSGRASSKVSGRASSKVSAKFSGDESRISMKFRELKSALEGKPCVDRFTATFSQWDGKTKQTNKPGKETNFGLFRRAHIRAHKRIRDTYDPMNYYYCTIE